MSARRHLWPVLSLPVTTLHVTPEQAVPPLGVATEHSLGLQGLLTRWLCDFPDRVALGRRGEAPRGAGM